MKNTPARAFHEWIAHVKSIEVNVCKRCGPRVCGLVLKLFDHCKGIARVSRQTQLH